MIDVLVRAYRLKDVARSGWVLRGVGDGESVADHSWGTGLLCLLFGPEAGIDVGRALAIALVHDLAEAQTGDVAALPDPHERSVSVAAKARLEAEAMGALRAAAGDELDLAHVLDAWHEYEAAASPEALFVRDMNLLDMCVQALVYARERRASAPPDGTGGERMGEFFASARARVATPTGRRLVAAVHAAYRSDAPPPERHP